MKKIINIILFTLAFYITGYSQSDSILNRTLLKTKVIQTLALHPNAGIEFPINPYWHVELNAGAFRFWTTFYEWPQVIPGLGISSSLALKKFPSTADVNSYFYHGPAISYRYFSSQYTNLGRCGECGERGYKRLDIYSFDYQLGFQNKRRSFDGYLRLGLKYNMTTDNIRQEWVGANGSIPVYYFEGKIRSIKEITPAFGIGFNLCLPM